MFACIFTIAGVVGYKYSEALEFWSEKLKNAERAVLCPVGIGIINKIPKDFRLQFQPEKKQTLHSDIIASQISHENIVRYKCKGDSEMISSPLWCCQNTMRGSWSNFCRSIQFSRLTYTLSQYNSKALEFWSESPNVTSKRFWRNCGVVKYNERQGHYPGDGCMTCLTLNSWRVPIRILVQKTADFA